MKKNTGSSNVLLAMSIVLMFCMFVDFLGLHDIRNDYVSPNVWNRFMTGSSILPWWTSTAGEWSIVMASYYVKLITIILLLILTLGRKTSEWVDR